MTRRRSHGSVAARAVEQPAVRSRRTYWLVEPFDELWYVAELPGSWLTPAGWSAGLWIIPGLWTIARDNDDAVARSLFNRAMTDDQRIWLEVSHAEQDAAKAAGARWDRALRAWYAPQLGIGGLTQWVGRPPLPDLLEGEDRSFGDGLFVDLIPDSCWFTNVRSCVSQRDWDRLRRMVYRRARDKCEVCGAGRDPAVSRWLEAHERWEYDEATRTQRLRRIVCLCSFCHEVTHFGLAIVRGHEERAQRHLLYVTGWSGRRAMRHVDDAFKLWEERCKVDWTLELGILLDAGIAVHEPPDPYERKRIGRC